MATKKEEQGIRFSFNVGLDVDRNGEVQCDLCDGHFVYPGVETMLRGFIVCPICVLADFPQYAAANAERTANDKERLAQREKDPIDQEDVRKEYLALVEELRGIKSIHEIPGGITARALAAASDTLRNHRDHLKALARGRKRGAWKAA
ncbi:MAG: hypothetical protein ACYC37_01885 [Desulfobacteria bacterium]